MAGLDSELKCEVSAVTCALSYFNLDLVVFYN